MKTATARKRSTFSLHRLSDAALLSAVFRHEEPAWRELMRRYRNLIYGCVHRTLDRFKTQIDSELADEIFSDVCFNLLRNDMRKLRAYRSDRGTKLGSWIGLIAVNATYDLLRRKARGPKHVPYEPRMDRVDPNPCPLSALLKHERSASVAALASQLSRRDYRFFQLYCVEERSPAEIAEDMKIAVKTVYAKRSKLTHQLKAILPAQNK